MAWHRYVFFGLVVFLLNVSCQARHTSQTKGVIDLNTPLPVSSSISVCWKNLSTSQMRCKSDLQSELERKFDEKTALQLTFRDTCDGSADVEILYQDSKHVNSRIETNGRTYSLMEIICDDFSGAIAPEIRSQCRSSEEARICNINIGLHEFGHAIGLSHEDLRPESPTGSTVYDDDKLVVLNKFDQNSIMHFAYYKDIVGIKILELSEGDILTINKLYEKDLTLQKIDCTDRYRFDEVLGRCFVKPTNGN